jgi:plastocyanin
VAAGGLALIALALIVATVVALVTGVSLDGILFIGMGLPLIAAALLWRFATRWSVVVALVVSLLVGLGMFWMAFGIAYPGAFGDFVPGVTFVVGVLVALGGAIAALVQRRRGNLTAVVTAGERRIMIVAGGVVAAAVVISAVLSATGAQSAPAVAGATPVTISDFAFPEGQYEVTAGEQAALAVHNSDGFTHDIAIPALDVSAQTVLPGRDATVDLSAAAPGTYTFYCTLHSDVSETDPTEAGMAATLIVR